MTSNLKYQAIILGGFNELGTRRVGREFFYLDVSVPFNTQNILWHDLTSINIIPAHLAAASVKGGAQNNTLFLYGGMPYDNTETMALIYAFDARSYSWGIPKMFDVNIGRKDNLKGIVDDKGKMYMFGGNSGVNLNDNRNDMIIFDTINLDWKIGSSINAPSPRCVFGSTLISDHLIIYIGGYDKVALSLNEVYLYDTIDDNWSTKKTSGKIPSNRNSFSVVLGLDGQRVIIFGGAKEYENLQSQNALYVLNLINYEWYIPKISGKIPSPRRWHEANVIGKYMVVSFGQGYEDNDILLLDISDNEEYIWTDNFDPTDPIDPIIGPSPKITSKDSPTKPSKVQPTASPTQTTTTPLNESAVIGIAIAVGFFVAFSVIYLYRWNKNRRESDNHENTRPTTPDNTYGQRPPRRSNYEPGMIPETPPSNNAYTHGFPPERINNNEQGMIPYSGGSMIPSHTNMSISANTYGQQTNHEQDPLYLR
ncbi:11834_t:CDS:2 [Funneliformis caledonium]|uniref:11834_t:CDS:1 n=1 Tax=Funneliformis caledonium TaxID=1117310 RepID=A0A9N8YXN4_9GLOM|nr:11834_t:CDS:2 [Funneliformis caledonium]